MSTPVWTPGPWHVVNRGTEDEPMQSVMAARIAGQPPRHEVALCATGDSPQWMEDANARLIAAAPDLYAALDAMLPENCGPADDPGGLGRPSFEKCEQARAALAKARGDL